MSNAKVRARRRRRAQARKPQLHYYDIETAVLEIGATSPPRNGARAILALAAMLSLGVGKF